MKRISVIIILILICSLILSGCSFLYIPIAERPNVLYGDSFYCSMGRDMLYVTKSGKVYKESERENPYFNSKGLSKENYRTTLTKEELKEFKQILNISIEDVIPSDNPELLSDIKACHSYTIERYVELEKKIRIVKYMETKGVYIEYSDVKKDTVNEITKYIDLLKNEYKIPKERWEEYEKADYKQKKEIIDSYLDIKYRDGDIFITNDNKVYNVSSKFYYGSDYDETPVCELAPYLIEYFEKCEDKTLWLKAAIILHYGENPNSAIRGTAPIERLKALNELGIDMFWCYEQGLKIFQPTAYGAITTITVYDIPFESFIDFSDKTLELSGLEAPYNRGFILIYLEEEETKEIEDIYWNYIDYEDYEEKSKALGKYIETLVSEDIISEIIEHYRIDVKDKKISKVY